MVWSSPPRAFFCSVLRQCLAINSACRGLPCFRMAARVDFADLTGRYLTPVHGIQQNRRPIAATGQDSLGCLLQMAGHARKGRDDPRCNFRGAEVLQAS